VIAFFCCGLLAGSSVDVGHLQLRSIYRTPQTCFCSNGKTAIDYLVAGGNQACLEEIRRECEFHKTPEHARILERLAEMISVQ
jgi:hypothetical protein